MALGRASRLSIICACRGEPCHEQFFFYPETVAANREIAYNCQILPINVLRWLHIFREIQNFF